MNDFHPKTLTLVIPALNEEEAIAQTVARCRAARETIRRAVPGLETQIVVVSDGSSDGTVALAESFPDVDVLVFERNRGYGAAIKTGFEYGRGDLVGFLDADGTCDPEFLADLCRAVVKGADVALGSRMGPDSQMPKIRRLGNTIFATILSVLSKRSVGDSASGMRVIRRDALARLEPLPDGLHYTPAMSARALMRDDLTIVELPMSYSERLGRSKLSVAKDGVRFLEVILATVLALRPARLLLVGVPVAVTATALGWLPVMHYLRFGSLEEWMIYRLLLSSLCAAVAAHLAFGAAVAEKVAALADHRRPASSGVTGLLRPLFSPRTSVLMSIVLIALAVVVTVPGWREFLSTGAVTMHWSRAVLGSLLASWSAGLLVTSVLLTMIDLLAGGRRISVPRPADRVRRAV